MRRWIAVGCAALVCLGCGERIGGKSRSQWEAHLSDPDSQARREAARSLGALGKASVPLLVKTMADTDPTVRQAAVEALVVADREGTASVEPLSKALEDPDWGVRDSAAKALGVLGTKAAAALPALQKALAAAKQSRDSPAQSRLQAAIGAVQGQGTMPDGA